MALAAGSRLGPYNIVARIGSGAMGEVWRARDTRLNRDVAIKTVSAAEAGDGALHRFEQEAQAVSALNHPSILTVHDVGREDDTAWIVSELIEGESLRAVLEARGALPQRMLLDIAIQIAEGLAAAHDAGIVHRDLKPENIMITRDGRAKILDFGIAKVMAEARSDNAATLNNETAPGLLLGTTAYMSPEQARGTRVTYWTDQFSFGLILYEMATGNAPFRRETGLATLSAILTEEAPLLETGSPLFQWLVRRLLHKEPDHRYGTMHDVLRELRAIRTNLTEPVEETPQPEPEAEVDRSGFALPARLVAAVFLGAALVIAVVFLWRRFPAPVQREVAREYRLFSARSGMDVMPAWSPDGRMIAWSSRVDGVMQIFVADSREQALAPLQLTSESRHCVRPVWSGDGSRIRFESGGSSWVVSAVGGAPEPATPGFRAAPEAALQVSERGGDLIISSRQSGRTDPLTASPGIELSPALSPDGHAVAFTSAHVRYELVRLRGGAATAIPEAGTRATHPALLADGTLVWVSDGRSLVTRQGRLYTNDTAITALNASEDGQRVIFRDARGEWWTLNPRGGGAVRASEPRQTASAPELPTAAAVEPDVLPGYPPVAGIAVRGDEVVVSVRRSTAEVWILRR